MTVVLITAALSVANATGLPPWEEVTVVDASCAPVQQIDRELFITFDRRTGTCAPMPEGPSCSTRIEASLDARKLVVRRQQCEEPLPGRFVRDGMCGEQPRWRWSGRLDAGSRYGIGRDFGGDLGGMRVVGEPDPGPCPAASKRTHPTRTETRVSPVSAPQWIAFPAEGYSVSQSGGSTHLVWTPGPSLRQWVLGSEAVALRSEPLAADAAHAVLRQAKVEPTGLAVRHQIVEHREWFEGWRRRGVARCERILQMDLEQRIRPSDPDQPLGPPMSATVELREPAMAERCTGATP